MIDENTTSTGLVPVEEFKQIIDAAPAALSINQDKTNKAVRAGERLLLQIQTEGMTEELDLQCNTYLVKLKNTYTDMYERRKPLTELFDRIRTVFTNLEQEVDAKKKGNMYSKVQEERNKFATAKIQEQKRKEEEAKRKQEREKALINLKATAETNLRNTFLLQLEQSKKNLLKCFEAITLADWEHAVKLFKEFPLNYRIDTWEAIVPVKETDAVSIMISINDWQQTNLNVKLGKFDTWAGEYYSAMGDLHQSLSQRLTSKRNELEEIAKAKGDEAKKLADEAEQRKKNDEAKLAKQAEEERLKAAEETEANKNVALTNSLFNTQLEMQSSDAGSKAVESYEIEVTNSAAWLLRVNFYFTEEGLKETADKLEKKTLGSMKKFAESFYKKHGKKIESPYIIYKPVYAVRTVK